MLIPMYSGGASSYYPNSGHTTTAPLTPLNVQRMENESRQSDNVFNKLTVMVNDHRDLVEQVEGRG
jgi:hypothetical protein